MAQPKNLQQIMLRTGTGYWEYFPKTDRMCCSPELLALIGLDETEAPTTLEACKAWIHPDDWPQLLSRYQALSAGDDQIYDTSYRLRCKDREERWMLERSFVLERDESGKPTTLGALLYDSTAPGRELREAKSRVNTQYGLLQAVNRIAALLLGDYEGDFGRILVEALGVLGDSVKVHRAYVWKNSLIDGRLHCRRLAEWEADSTIRQEGESGWIPYDAFFPDLDKLLASQGELLLHVDDMGAALAAFPGIEGVVSLLAMPVMLYGEFWGFVGFDDMQERRSFTPAQLDILKSGGMLIASGIMRNEMIDSLIEAREEALASMNAKSEFLSRMSHEIRTPMNAIIGMNEIAKTADDPQRIKYCLAKIEQASHQLLGLINDILDLSKIESGKMEINHAEFDFEKMLHNVYTMVQPRVEEKGLNFSFNLEAHCDRYLISDELRLTQVVANLLSNAVKFTPQGGTVTLHARLEEQSDDRALLRIEVQDTGIGISPEKQAKLFQPFEQADGSITRRFGGTGLGLSICRNIIDLMSGTIWVESQPGLGSRFMFEVAVQLGRSCLAQPADLPKDRTAQTHYAWPGKTILMAEDIEINQEIVRSLLEPTGIAIECAANGLKALEMYAAAPERYSLVLMDVQMPEMDGYEATRRLRASGWANAADIPILAMTADAFLEDVKRCREAGMNDHISKPIDVNELMEKLDLALRTERSVL